MAEVINQPATILFRLSFKSGILDTSEGPVTQSMKTEFNQLLVDSRAADEKYNAKISKEPESLDALLK